MTESEKRIVRAYWWAYWRIYNGFEIRLRERFFWLNCMGVGVGKLDHEGLGRGQWVRYWKKEDA